MIDSLKSTAPRDSELVHAARAGDVSSLGVLLARHEAGTYAVALSLLGHSHSAGDAVQDAALIALRRIGDLRDPEAADPWLRTVVRNACRSHLRRTSSIPVADLAFAEARDRRHGPPEDPAEILDRHVLRDWIWSALEELTSTLRLVAMLRYFTRCHVLRGHRDAVRHTRWHRAQPAQPSADETGACARRHVRPGTQRRGQPDGCAPRSGGGNPGIRPPREHPVGVGRTVVPARGGGLAHRPAQRPGAPAGRLRP
jgi:RNA polymerase sigma factor (sigma-70 family)